MVNYGVVFSVSLTFGIGEDTGGIRDGGGGTGSVSVFTLEFTGVDFTISLVENSGSVVS